MNDLFQHLLVSIAFVVVLLFLANPFNFWVPSGLQLVIAGAVAVVAAIFVGLVYQDEGRDEREVLLRGTSARVGYAVGIIVLTLCIIYALVTGTAVNLWVLVALGAMILSRVIHRVM